MFVVFGQKMGPANLVQVSSFPLPTSLAGTSIKVSVQATTVDAIMIYSMASQVAAVLPSRTLTGDGTLTVTYGGLTSPPVSIHVVRSAFGIFTRNQAGTGPAIIQNVNSEADRPLNAFTNAARPGQTMILWGTGLGPVSGDEASGPLPGDLNIPVQVVVGDKDAKVLYKGRSGCCVGVDQIVFEVPQGVEGCLVRVRLRANDVPSNVATMSIAATGSVCSEHGLSGTDFEKPAAGSPLNVGYVSLGRSAYWFANQPSGATSEAGGAVFYRYSWADLVAALGAPQGVIGSCDVYLFTLPTSVSSVPSLDAGPTLEIRGPIGRKTLSRMGSSPNYSYVGVFSPEGGPAYLVPGEYTATGVGGAAVGAFQTTLTILPSFSFKWTNHSGINNVQRSRDLAVTWSGGDATKQRVNIIGTSAATGRGGSFICTAPMGAGQFTIPPSVLSSIPASTQTGGGSLQVISELLTPTRFTAPSLHWGYVTFREGYTKGVNYQ
jgi:uncharacterized protein (TIGR03437 family)